MSAWGWKQFRHGGHSHTHSGPILADTLDVMAIMPEKDQAEEHSLELQSKLIQVVSEACADLQPLASKK